MNLPWKRMKLKIVNILTQFSVHFPPAATTNKPNEITYIGGYLQLEAAACCYKPVIRIQGKLQLQLNTLLTYVYSKWDPFPR